MKRIYIAIAAAALLSACQAKAPAAPEDALSNGPPVAPPTKGWELIEGGPLRMSWREGDSDLSITCEEAKKTLRFDFSPAWELDGPHPLAKITLGDKTFDAPADPASVSADKYRPNYVLPANADTVTALMMATNAVIALPDNSQTREGATDAQGAFDMFATTCAQINGLR